MSMYADPMWVCWVHRNPYRASHVLPSEIKIHGVLHKELSGQSMCLFLLVGTYNLLSRLSETGFSIGMPEFVLGHLLFCIS